MKQQEAERLLNETFNNEFNSGRYVHFLSELLKGKLMVHDKSLGVNKEFEEYIKSFKKIGEYKNGRNNIEVFAVELKRVSSLERARTMQRNFVAKWLHNEFLPKDAGLVAFYGDNPEDWRFSFVKMEYKLGEDGKVLKELTPAKRYSFLVGKNEPNHTCKRQFLKLLAEDDIPPTLEELERAFSVENVTKEFFEEYKNRFFELRDSIEKVIEKNPIVRKEFESKNINSVEFSKKLLGQIVFLYFLQKKGWLGVKRDSDGKFNDWGTGPKDFMKKLFNKEIVSYDNFFNDVLEPLFYQALANDRSADNDYYEKLKCKVPFLNGGLFEPIKDYDWTKTDILLDNAVFKDIFSTFDQFNFTIKEDEPLEREVAVDPEMLGKVFENLLDVNDRKSKGAFYTPREIVHYMCQQSLINYLETNTSQLGLKREDIELFILKGDIALDRLRRANIGRASAEDIRLILPKTISSNYKELDRLLREIKICDPAVGSGAFPVGMMNEIVRARNILSYFFLPSEKAERTDYNLKRQTIENSLYGVDIESSAVEITKLRFWLSLIVDELDMKNIRPLPNLDNRIMCGNSLIEEFEGIKLFDENLANEKIAKQMTLFKKGSEYKLETLQKLQADYFNEQDRNKKKKLMKDIENLEWEFIEDTLKEENNEEALKKLEQYKTSKSKPFFLWKLYFSDVFKRDNPGFDVVIGNPPYVQLMRMDGAEVFSKENYQTYSKSTDLYCLFYEKGVYILRNEGVLSYITSNSWMRTKYGQSLRDFFAEKTNPLQLINFENALVFDSAIVESNILILQKSPFNKRLMASNIDENFRNYTSLKDYLSKNNAILEKLASNGWIIGSDKSIKLKNKIEANSKTIKELEYYIVRGFTTGCNEAFYISQETKDEIITEDKNSKDYIKPIIRGRDLKKWCLHFDEIYALVMTRGFDINKYPAIKKHLSSFKDKLENKTGTSKWYELQANPSKDILSSFLKEKIIWGELSDEPKFVYDDKGYFLDATVFLIIGKNLKFILPILNSRLSRWYFEQIATSSGMGTNRWKKYKIEQFPIKNTQEKEQKPFIEIVDRILSITNDKDYTKNSDKQAMVKAYEKKIDKMVYELYELTPEEIKIIEEFGK